MINKKRTEKINKLMSLVYELGGSFKIYPRTFVIKIKGKNVIHKGLLGERAKK